MTVAALLLIAFGAYLSVYLLYLSLLFLANACIREPEELAPATVRRFNVVVPAHNEEMYLPRLLESLRTQEYPNDRYRVTVVADNCTDGTVAACRSVDVDLFERTSVDERGKGHTIRWVLDRIGLEAFDAVAIVDGDSLVGSGFLKHLNLQMDRGDLVIQCYNGVANPGQSWFTRLMDVSRTIGNDILHPAKRKLGLSSHLMGNGMCFDAALLRTQGWNAFSVGEDWEYYARLVLGGAYVGYSRHAKVYHQESVNLKQASSQRLRWSSGRFQVLRQYGPALLAAGIRTRSWRCIDASLPLLFPNPSLGMNLTFVGLLASAIYWQRTGGAAILAWYVALSLLQLAMFMIGVLHTRDKVASALSLLLAPVFLVWKMAIDILSMTGIGTREWKRTERRSS